MASTATPTVPAPSPSRGWWERGACRGAPLELFVTPSEGSEDPQVDDEGWRPSPLAAAYCLPCPVAADCLAEAQRTDAWGTWGWTSRHQRRQLRRRRRRRACPRCEEQHLMSLPGGQVCLACGVSWPA